MKFWCLQISLKPNQFFWRILKNVWFFGDLETPKFPSEMNLPLEKKDKSLSPFITMIQKTKLKIGFNNQPIILDVKCENVFENNQHFIPMYIQNISLLNSGYKPHISVMIFWIIDKPTNVFVFFHNEITSINPYLKRDCTSLLVLFSIKDQNTIP